MQVLIQCVVLLVGFAALVKGADLFVDGVSGIAERFGIPQLVIGLTDRCRWGRVHRKQLSVLQRH